MKIAIVGTGNVGGALATKWSHAGHEIFLGVRDLSDFKGEGLLSNPNTTVHSIQESVKNAEVILLATPAMLALDVARSLGDVADKVIIDSMNIVRGNAPEGFTNTSDAILSVINTVELAKCFNTTGFNNIIDTHYEGIQIDAFMCGDSEKAKDIALQLALDAGFGSCYDIGSNDKFQLMEQFAYFWINLAIQGQGRDIAFKLLKR